MRYGNGNSKNVLNALDLGTCLDFNTETKPSERKQREALALLGSALTEENLGKIVDCDNFEQAWKNIEKTFVNKTTYEPQALFRRLNNFKINSANEVSSGISEMRSIVSQLKNLKETVSDNCLIGAILSSLPKSFELFTMVWKNSNDCEVDSLISKLMAEAAEQIDKEKDKTTQKALATQGQQKDKKNSNKKGKKVGRDQCRYCKEMGHWIKDCTKLKSPYDPEHSKKKGKRDNMNDRPDNKKDIQDLSLMVNHISTLNMDKNLWVADSGCTNHMTPYKDLFENYEEITDGNVYLADDTTLKVIGKGNISTKYGTLKEVWYVPKLKQNLFSITAVAAKGIKYTGSGEQLVFYRGDKELFKAKLHNKLYLINFNIVEKNYANAANLEKWHARFGHVSIDSIKRMAKIGAVNDLAITNTEKNVCIDCKMNKCTNSTHPNKSSSKARKPGHTLHMDTAGPSDVPSLGNSKYTVLCKDESSAYRLIDFVKSKDEIPSVVKKFISRATLETGNEVLKLVTDNGSEFCNTTVKSFLESRGILHHKSAPYTPMQNGYIERDFRTVKESTKTLLHNSKLDKRLWSEAMNCSIYALNRSINTANQNVTPYELWFQKKPSVKNLHVFGEAAILLDQKTQETSWHSKGKKVTFVGYTDLFNTFRFLDEMKIIISCDVVFLNKFHYEVNDKLEDINLKDTYDEEEIWIQAGEIDIDDHNVTAETSSLDISELDESSLFQSPMRQTTSQDAAEILIPIREVIVRDPTQELNNLIDENRNKNVAIRFENDGGGIDIIQIDDVQFSNATGRWRNKKTGHFLGKDRMKVIENTLKRQAKSAYSMLVGSDISIPDTYQQAITGKFSEEWKLAADEEILYLEKNDVFDEVEATLVKKKPVDSKWVFTLKTKANGEVLC